MKASLLIGLISVVQSLKISDVDSNIPIVSAGSVDNSPPKGEYHEVSKCKYERSGDSCVLYKGNPNGCLQLEPHPSNESCTEWIFCLGSKEDGKYI